MDGTSGGAAPAAAPEGGAPRKGWSPATRFALLVTGIGAGASAAIVSAAMFMLRAWTPEIVWTLVGGGLLIAAVATPLHVVLLVAAPPRSRWGLFGRAVLAAYAGVVIAVAVLMGPAIAIGVVYALAVFTVSGAFLVPGTVAALSARLLDRRLRWYSAAAAPVGGGSHTAPTAPAVPPGASVPTDPVGFTGAPGTPP